MDSLQARHALSADLKCSWSADDSAPGFSNLKFYQRILSTVGLWSEDDKKSLIKWWNLCVIQHLLLEHLLTSMTVLSSRISMAEFTRVHSPTPLNLIQ